MPLISENPQGVIAQLGERYNGIVEVGGSIPPGSTMFYNLAEALIMVFSKAGGHVLYGLFSFYLIASSILWWPQ